MSTFEGSEKKLVSVGPWGGQTGLIWEDGVYSTVKQLVIAHGGAIDSIQVEYDEKGTSFWAERHGGNGGWKTDTVKLAYPEEFLTSIEGHYGKISEWGPVSIRSLKFKSNKKTYGPFGIEQGTYFSLPAARAGSSKIVGFFGKSGWYLDSIGAYLKPIQNDQNQPSKTTLQTESYMIAGTDQNLAGYSVLQNCDVFFAIRPKDDYTANPAAVPVPNNKLSMQFSNSGELSDVETKFKTPSIEKVPAIAAEGVVTYGPWGGTGGFAFDDGVYSGVRQIKLSRNVGVVIYIRVQYDCDGEAVWGAKHGGTGGYKSDKIVFDFPNEILTHITGTFGAAMIMGPNVIKSLTFHTTKKKHGPYGEEQGTPFTTKPKEGKIVGIHGRKGLFLDALGVHATEGKVNVETEKQTPPVTNTPNNCTAIIPKEPVGC